MSRHRIIARGAIWALALCFGTTGTDAATQTPAETQIRELIEPYRPEIEEAAQLMYTIGACERFIKKSSVDFYIKEYMAGPVPDGLEGEWQRNTQDVYSRLYTEGRADADKLGFDQTQCQRAIDAAGTSLQSAVAARKVKLGQ